MNEQLMKQDEITATNEPDARSAAENQAVGRVHLVGRKNSGKTTLICDLVKILTKRGLAVATIKHTHHNHELDTPGKDSWQHREAGATAVGILAAEMSAIFLPGPRSDDESQRYRAIESALSGCDLILVEGDLSTAAPKIEVWREAVSEVPYAVSEPSIGTIVTDDEIHGGDDDSRLNDCLKIRRSDLEKIADQVVNLSVDSVAKLPISRLLDQKESLGSSNRK